MPLLWFLKLLYQGSSFKLISNFFQTFFLRIAFRYIVKRQILLCVLVKGFHLFKGNRFLVGKESVVEIIENRSGKMAKLNLRCNLSNCVETHQNLSEISWAQIPVYVLHLIPYHANIILQNLYVFGAFMKKRCIAILRESAEHPFRHGKSDISLK